MAATTGRTAAKVLGGVGSLDVFLLANTFLQHFSETSYSFQQLQQKRCFR